MIALPLDSLMDMLCKNRRLNAPAYSARGNDGV